MLGLLGGKRSQVTLGPTADHIAEQVAEEAVFSNEEKDTIHGVLTLADRSGQVDHDAAHRYRLARPRRAAGRVAAAHRRRPFALPGGAGQPSTISSASPAPAILRDLIVDGSINVERSIREPFVVHESISALKLMEQLRHSSVAVADRARRVRRSQGM